MCVYIYIYISEKRPRQDLRVLRFLTTFRVPEARDNRILAIFYPFSQFCEIDVSLPSL